MQPAELVFEVAALDATFAVTRAIGLLGIAVAPIIVHLRADDGADREAADDAGSDLAVFRLRGLGRDINRHRQGSNGGKRDDFQHGLIPFKCLSQTNAGRALKFHRK
jgi:hypothetical protein